VRAEKEEKRRDDRRVFEKNLYGSPGERGGFERTGSCGSDRDRKRERERERRGHRQERQRERVENGEGGVRKGHYEMLRDAGMEAKTVRPLLRRRAFYTILEQGRARVE